MASLPESFKASDLASEGTITLNVKLIKDWRFRLGIWISVLGMRIAGFKVKVKDEIVSEPPTPE